MTSCSASQKAPRCDTAPHSGLHLRTAPLLTWKSLPSLLSSLATAWRYSRTGPSLTGSRGTWVRLGAGVDEDGGGGAGAAAVVAAGSSFFAAASFSSPLSSAFFSAGASTSFSSVSFLYLSIMSLLRDAMVPRMSSTSWLLFPFVCW